MKQLQYIPLIFLLLFPLSFLQSQTTLTQTEAVKKTLANNYGIKVAENNIEIAENNTSKENNRYLPTVNANAASNANLGGSTQRFGNGNENLVKSAFSWNANASITANYMLYDQTRTYGLEQLKEVLNLSELQLRQTIEMNLLQLMNGYYNTARLTENLEVLSDAIELSKSRLQRTQYQQEYGQGTRLNMLNAQVDIQRDSINYLNIQQQLVNAKRNLQLIMTDIEMADFEVETGVVYQEGLLLEQLIADAQENNIQVLLANKNIYISNYDLQIIEAQKKPTIGANASYSYSFQDNAAEAFITSSNSRGWSAGVNLSWNLFDGGARKVRTQNTLVNIKNQQIQKEQLLQELQINLTNAWGSYQNALYILKVEEANVATNQLNLDYTQERFKTGQVSSVEFRQAQLNLLNASTNFNLAKYDAKIIELELIQLSGGLLEGLVD
ncbi:MAG: TolC family protein [Chitinophagales bacterium]